MARKQQNDDDEVIAGGTGPQNRGNGHDAPGITSMDYWEKDFENMPFWTRIEKLLDLPPIKDMAGVMIRSIVKNERQGNAILRLSYRHKKFKDNNHQEMLREKLGMTVGIGGVGRLDALFGVVNMVAPDMYRTARGMPRKEGPRENVKKSSDFRESRDEPRPEER